MQLTALSKAAMKKRLTEQTFEYSICKNKEEVITVPDRDINYLSDFVKEINTKDMLASERQVLMIREVADK